MVSQRSFWTRMAKMFTMFVSTKNKERPARSSTATDDRRQFADGMGRADFMRHAGRHDMTGRDASVNAKELWMTAKSREAGTPVT